VQIEEPKDADRAQHRNHDRKKTWMKHVFGDKANPRRNKADERQQSGSLHPAWNLRVSE